MKDQWKHIKQKKTLVMRTAACFSTLISSENVYCFQVATRGATLYFVLADLSGIDVMYQFSLDWFQQEMFISCITNQNMVAMNEIARKSSISPHLTGVLRPDSRQSVTRVSMDNKASVDLLGKLKESITTVNTDDPAELKKHMLDMINR